MSWSSALPNLLIGLREGLEAGLVVTILLAALRKQEVDGRRLSTAPIWLGVLGAISVAGSFAAVLTFSTSVLSSRGQAAVGGLLSVLAVGLVTAMVFWMRRAAAGLSGHLRSEVAHALVIGSGALAVTAFLAVGREGLETTLFLWTAVRATGHTIAPLVGAALGLAIAAALCWLLFRRAIKLNLGAFFSRTAILLIVIAAGVLSYGLGDLQEAGWLAGNRWVAFDLSAHIDASSWWASLVTGITELSTRMTVLQAVAWVVYLAVVVPLFLRTRMAAPGAATGSSSSRAEWWERLAGRRPLSTGIALVVGPAVIAAVTILALPAASASDSTALTVTRTSCAGDWSTGHTGQQDIAVTNSSGRSGEVNLDDSDGAVVAELETLGPGTTATMSATLSAGTYTVHCLLSGMAPAVSAPIQVTGASAPSATTAVLPVTVAQLTPPNTAYEAYAAKALATLATTVGALGDDLRQQDLTRAQADWLTAQTQWELVGASYDSFGDLGVAIDGLPAGLPKGVEDPGFTGLHRLEYGLWHGQPAATLLPVQSRLAHDVADLRTKLTSDAIAGDPTNLPIRAHEILEDALRDHLAGLDDEGAAAAYAETAADVTVTRTVLSELQPLVAARAASLPATLSADLATVSEALEAARQDGQWRAPSATPAAARLAVDAALGQSLEDLASVPDLLEVPPGA